MSVRHLILATAGHVDHGKSSLVRALTGTDPDRLPEEKARGMTIELGFAHLDLRAAMTSASETPSPPGRGWPEGPGEGLPTVFRLGIVDVPGHEDFVKNMVAGVGSIDLALLVVAADDGWMPQTQEHLEILTYLGVARGVVALSKIDRATDEPAAIAAVRERLKGTPLAEAETIPTAAPQGRGLDELRAALLEACRAAPAPADIGKPRLPVDRAFTLTGVGTVVTGTLGGGVLSVGQEVRVLPAGTSARIRRIQTYGEDAKVATPGTRVALNLAGIQPGGVGKGNVIALGGAATKTFEALVMRHPPPGATASPAGEAVLKHSPIPADARPALRNGARVHLHHGSAAIPARVYLLEDAEVAPGGRAIAQLRLESPAFVFAQDRFVLRDWSGRHTLAGGVILDPRALRRDWRRAERRTLLEMRAANPDDAAAWVASEVAARRIVSAGGLLEQSRFAQADIAAAAQRSPFVRAGGLLIDPPLLADAGKRVADAVDAMHREHPEHAGLPLASLRPLLGDVDEAVAPAFAEAVLEHLCRQGFARDGSVIRRTSHRPALPPRLAAAGQRIRAALSQDPLNPPSRKQLATQAAEQEALRYLLKTGEAVELSPDCVISAAALDGAIANVRQHITRHGPATVSDLKTQLASSRRTVVPLLEHLDCTGVTRRRGDLRELR
jgi:selenocysteine-specific elongation factor